MRPPTPLFQGGGPVCSAPSCTHGIGAGPTAAGELLRVSTNASTAATTTRAAAPPMISSRRLSCVAGVPAERTGGGAFERGGVGAPIFFVGERLATVGDRTSVAAQRLPA